MKRQTALLFMFLATLSVALHAQTAANPDTMRAGFGVYGNYNLNFHSADFRKLPGVPNCCPRFETGDGSGFTFGALYVLPLEHSLAIDIRAGYTGYGALLSAREATTVSIEGSAAPGVFEHTIDASLSSIGIEPLADYRVWKTLSLMAGPRFAIVLSKKYDQKEEIVVPADRGVFQGLDTRTRNIISGDIPDAGSLQFALLAGLRYEVPLNRKDVLSMKLDMILKYRLSAVVRKV